MKESIRIIIYDGECGICNRSMLFAMKRLRSKYQIFPFVTEQLATDYGNCLFEISQKSIILIINNTILKKSAAIKMLFYDFGYPYKLFAFLMEIKLISLFTDLLYSIISKNRRRLSKLLGLNQCTTKHQSS